MLTRIYQAYYDFIFFFTFLHCWFTWRVHWTVNYLLNIYKFYSTGHFLCPWLKLLQEMLFLLDWIHGHQSSICLLTEGEGGHLFLVHSKEPFVYIFLFLVISSKGSKNKVTSAFQIFKIEEVCCCSTIPSRYTYFYCFSSIILLLCFHLNF